MEAKISNIETETEGEIVLKNLSKVDFDISDNTVYFYRDGFELMRVGMGKVNIIVDNKD